MNNYNKKYGNPETIDDINLGDIFLVYGGANQHGSGQQIAIVNKITKYGNIYCEKLSIRKKKSIGKKCRLALDDIRFRLRVVENLDHQYDKDGNPYNGVLSKILRSANGVYHYWLKITDPDVLDILP